MISYCAVFGTFSQTAKVSDGAKQDAGRIDDGVAPHVEFDIQELTVLFGVKARKYPDVVSTVAHVGVAAHNAIMCSISNEYGTYSGTKPQDKHVSYADGTTASFM